MNEQDLILKQKIEKREKIDTILAYILLVILIGAILLVLYLKFIRKEEMKEPEEYVPNYISLNDISTSLNNSTLANRYLNDSATLNSSVSGNSIVVKYVKDDNNLNLNIPQVGNELEINVIEDNEIVKDVYKELAAIICVYYGNTESNCRRVTDNITNNSKIDGIRFVNIENNNYIYISMLKSVDINAEIVYNNVTKTSINNTNYTLNLEETSIYDINIIKEAENYTFSGTIERTNDDNSNVTVVIKLYDSTGELKGENKYIFDESNPLGEKNIFTISFMFNEEDINSVNTYSIEVIK